MKTILKVILCLVCLVQTAGFLTAAETKGNKAGTSRAIDPYVIEDVAYYIQGRTIERILAERIAVDKGREFATREALDAYIAEKEQLLENERVLGLTKIEAAILEVRDGVTYVRLDVYTKDSWNIVALPYPRYNSNDGLLLSIRLRDYNFLGSMETLELNLDYERDTEDVTTFGADTSFSVPFTGLGQEWEWALSLEASYGSDEIFRFTEKTDVSMQFDFLVPWTLSLYQEYKLNEEDDGPDPDGYYLTNGVSMSAGIEVLKKFLWFGPLTYSPSASLSINYNFKDWISISESRRGPTLNLDQSLSAGKVNWKKNFRDGTKFSVSNSNSYNFYSMSEGDPYPWDHGLTGEFFGFKEAYPFGYSARLRGMWEFEDDSGGSEGGPLRGILDKRMTGDLAFYLNSDMAVKTWIWFMARWFEMHTSVFFDMGVIRTYQGDFQDPFYAGGIEFVVFPKFARSMLMRASLGVDLEALFNGADLFAPAPRDGKESYELSIGLGYHY